MYIHIRTFMSRHIYFYTSLSLSLSLSLPSVAVSLSLSVSVSALLCGWGAGSPYDPRSRRYPLQHIVGRGAVRDLCCESCRRCVRHLGGKLETLFFFFLQVKEAGQAPRPIRPVSLCLSTYKYIYSLFIHTHINMYICLFIYMCIYMVTPPPPHGIPPPPPNGKARNPCKGRTFVSKVPTVTGMGPPNPGSS